MKYQYWIGAAVLLIVGYFIGTKYPNFWQNIPGLGS